AVRAWGASGSRSSSGFAPWDVFGVFISVSSFRGMILVVVRAVAQTGDVVVREAFGLPVGGAGLGAARVAHQTGVDQLDLVPVGGTGVVVVDPGAAFSVHAQQGVGVGLDTRGAEFLVQ